MTSITIDRYSAVLYLAAEYGGRSAACQLRQQPGPWVTVAVPGRPSKVSATRHVQEWVAWQQGRLRHPLRTVVVFSASRRYG